MWVVSKGLARLDPALRPLGLAIGGVFCVTLLISTITGGNMFRAWNVADITKEYFGVPPLVTGIVLMVLTGLVIVGGIRRIGTVAGRLVPFMCVAYLVASGWVLMAGADQIPELFRMIVTGAFAPQQAQGAFLGGAFGSAFLLGMRRALFSNEAGQGSAPIAHSAARTDEPVREGVVAGLEPVLDTLVVCTITALVILLSGVWNRAPDVILDASSAPGVVAAGPGLWTLERTELPLVRRNGWAENVRVFAVVSVAPEADQLGDRHRVPGVVREQSGRFVVEWQRISSPVRPTVAIPGVYREYKGATLTAKAFDNMVPGLGVVIVPAVAWLFAFSTMISWSYYGEQGAVFLFGSRSVMPYRVLYCLLVLLAASPLIETEAELDTVSSLGTGVMLFANIPIMLLFGRQAMRAYHDYMGRLDRGEFTPVRPQPENS